MAVQKPMVWNPATGRPDVLQTGDTISGATGTISFTEVEIDFGVTPVCEKTFNVVDAAIAAGDKILVFQSGNAPTGKNADDNEMDMLHLVATSKAGSFDLYTAVIKGYQVAGKYKIAYLKG